MSNFNFSEQLEQIETLMSSNTNSDKSCAYSMLLHLQEKSTSDDMLSQLLVKSSQSLLSFSVKDAEDKDEEISALSLKCLGFMIYFPAVVSKIPEHTAGAVLEMLAGVIMTTKMKIICNLAVWCLSIQNLDPSVLADHSSSLVRAIVHSLDNPTGSLSTTFEGTQVIIKLANQIKKTMKDTSSIWGPPVIRRLVSADKKERDMCQRCLLKVETTIYPPSLSLSKVIFQDLRPKLLPGINELSKHGKKVQALHAWKWLILLMGSHAVKNRHLVNELLKVTEQTFSDHDPQVQVASLVAWEGLIDVLIALPLDISTATSLESLEITTMMRKSTDQVKTDRFMKRLKLIMTPLIGFMSSTCDSSVQSSCLSTWRYLLHKLDIYINDSAILSAVVEPILQSVFQLEHEDRINYLSEFCINLLDDFIQSKNSNTVKWLPWDCSHLGFLLRMFNCVIRKMTSSEWVISNFRIVFKRVQLHLGRISTSYDDIMQSLNTTLKFVNSICEDVNLTAISLQLIKVIVQELDPSLLGSPLYKLPIISLTKMYFSLLIHMVKKSDTELLLEPEVYSFLKLSHSPLETIRAIVDLLYDNCDSSCLKLWVAVAEGVREFLDSGDEVMLLNTEGRDGCDLAVCRLFVFPLIMSMKPFEEVKRTWSSLYCSIIASTRKDSFAEDLCLLVNEFLDSNCTTQEEVDFDCLCGELVICVLDNMQVRKANPQKHDSDCEASTGMTNCFVFIARVVLKLSGFAKNSDVIQRTFSSLTQFVRRLRLRQDILDFTKVIFDALVPWMSYEEEMIAEKLQLLWSEILTSLQTSKPAIIFNSCYLQLQSNVLKIALDHPISSIRDPTISFWNNTYGEQTRLDFPPSLMRTLDKLSRRGKIKINRTTTLNMNSKRVQVPEPSVSVKRRRRELTEHQKEVRRAQQGRERDCGAHGPGIRTYTGLDFSQGNEYDDSQDQESQEVRNPEVILDLLKRPIL